MNLRSLFVSTLAASALLLTASANAHDPSLHEDHAPPEAKAKPVNCKQLADNVHFSNDMGDPDIKALKTKCDAEQKANAEPVPGKIK
ncbi:hypothetical protein [Dokdonella sp.]|uniref:hypothetical protein n=1 Tax=Dokdonella sp. TaxID=2291710 RepID=UPI003C3BD63B